MESYKNVQESRDQKNKEALAIVNYAQSVLDKLREDPSKQNFHDPKAGSQWAGEWLKNQKEAILEIYQSSSLDDSFVKHEDIPQEIANFVRDVDQTLKL